MRDIVAVGYACVDIYENLEKNYPTGNGVDVIMNLCDKGVTTSLVTFVGDDRYGENFMECLNEKKIESRHVKMVSGATASIKMNLIEGNREHCEVSDGVMANFYLDDESKAFIKQHKYIHTDFFGRIYGMLNEFQQAGCKIIFDFSVFLEDKDIDMIFPNVDIGLFSANDFDESIKQKMIRAYHKGTKLIISTLGEHGSVAYDGKNFYHQPAIKVARVVNTVGAGDSFLAGVIYGMLQEKQMADCLTIGAEFANKTITKFEPY